MAGKKILVVDDDDLVQIAVSELLRSRGYDVTTASSGAEALATMAGATFDLVLLDVIMPQMNGLEVCKRIRAMEGNADLPIIMLTAKSADEDRLLGMEAGANLYLPKPIAPTRLIQLVQETLRG
jgi:CheY-like chemotaxis protein